MLAAIVRREREVLLGELHVLRGLEHADALSALLGEGAALQVEARLRLLDRAEDGAPELARAAAAPRSGAARRAAEERAAG